MEVNSKSIERWGSMGLLEGLPIWEKNELALILDNATKVVIDQIERKSLNDDFLDVYDTVYIPICRRLYRRVGPRFDVIKMMDKLFEELSNNFKTLKADIESERNEKLSQKDPVVNFCINFSDSYEDEETLKSLLSTEDYENKVDLILQRVRDVLLNNRNVLSFKKNDVDWDIKLSEEERSIAHVRFWNQKMSNTFLLQALSDINKGI
jgi:hypothetical protein